ncbi:MAG: choline-sulfatase [Ardenticatenales bacterium]|nr:choline-sulfatase [Ardenticatenales bacterium]
MPNPDQSVSQPNILMIMVDQLAAPALACYGHPLTKTPNLDRLAASGVVFENAYCNSPLCSPSRASMMTGQLPSQIGTYDNAAHFSADIPTLAHYLRAAGYQTCLSGKMHFVGPDQLHGFEERLTTDIYPADYGWTPDWEQPEVRPSWYHNMLSVVQAGTCVSSNQLDFDEEVAYHSVRHLSQLARRDDTRPWFLLASFTHPHDPFAIPQAYWDRYDHAAIDMPAVPQLPYDELDPHSQRLHHVCAMAEYEQTPERVRNARHAYYGAISYIDDKVGQLLAGLEATGQADNTIILFVSDHGEMLGERGLWYKMSFFEWSARVPIILHAPRRWAARRVATPVSLVDILPTLSELAGHPATAPELAGQSLVPLAEGAAEERTVYGEMLAEGAVAPLLLIRRGNYKYIYSEPDPEQLYDLANDPLEMDNLAGKPEFQTLCSEFRAEMNQKWAVAALHQQILASQRRRRLVDAALRQGEHSPWEFQPFEDAAQKYMRNHMDLNVLEKTARFPSPDVPPPDHPL